VVVVKKDPILRNCTGKFRDKLIFGDNYPRVSLPKMRFIKLKYKGISPCLENRAKLQIRKGPYKPGLLIKVNRKRCNKLIMLSLTHPGLNIYLFPGEWSWKIDSDEVNKRELPFI
jgi:hypothetical protein